MKTPEDATDNKVSKTPEEIKKGLELCTTVGSHCDECPYDGHCLTDRPPEVDALAYILQLENDLQYTTDAANIMKDEALKLESRLAQVERERDAAMRDMAVIKFCAVCLHDGTKDHLPFACTSCGSGKQNWRWRGVCPENTKED